MTRSFKLWLLLAAVATAIVAISQGCGKNSDSSATVSMSLQEVH